MSKITHRFAELKSQNKKAVIPYIMAGDPDVLTTVKIMHAMVAAGAHIIELGMPFSDPMADGPVIALAAERALKNGTNTLDVFKVVKDFRQNDQQTPIVLMGYLNPVEIIGYENFASLAAESGVDGVLIVDLPPEEGIALQAVFKKNLIDLIYLIAPTTTPERIKKIIQAASGYLYYVSLKGVTGSATLNQQSVIERMALIKQQTNLPIGVGFGISDGETAKNLAQAVDAVIIGSVLVKQLDQPNMIQAIENIAAKVAEINIALNGDV